MISKPPFHPTRQTSGEFRTADPRGEIVEYLRSHPAAVDSLDGIVGWWLPLQRYERARESIQHALDDLVRQGIVDELVRGDTRLYRLARGRSRC